MKSVNCLENYNLLDSQCPRCRQISSQVSRENPRPSIGPIIRHTVECLEAHIIIYALKRVDFWSVQIYSFS